jgi:small multidrug resistance pump
VTVISYVASFYCLSLTLKTLPVGVAYAIWSCLAIVMISLAGAVWFRQMLDAPAMIGIGLIVAGVATINLFSKATTLGG